MLQWFGYLEKMDEEKLIKKKKLSDVRCTRLRGTPKIRWMDSVKRVRCKRYVA